MEFPTFFLPRFSRYKNLPRFHEKPAHESPHTWPNLPVSTLGNIWKMPAFSTNSNINTLSQKKRDALRWIKSTLNGLFAKSSRASSPWAEEVATMGTHVFFMVNGLALIAGQPTPPNVPPQKSRGTNRVTNQWRTIVASVQPMDPFFFPP